jgi:hypothetical protein
MGAPLYSLAAMILRLLSHEAHLLIGQNLRRTDPGIGQKRGLLIGGRDPVQMPGGLKMSEPGA